MRAMRGYQEQGIPQRIQVKIRKKSKFLVFLRFTVRPRIQVRPDWQIRTDFRDARLRTGTLEMFFFLNRSGTCGYGPHLITKSKSHIHITESHLLIQNCTITFTNQSTEPTCSEPLQVCWPSCMRMFADVFSCTYTD